MSQHKPTDLIPLPPQNRRIGIVGRDDADTQILLVHLEALDFSPVLLDSRDLLADFDIGNPEPFTQICIVDADSLGNVPNGLSACQTLRKAHPAVPVLATAREANKLAGPDLARLRPDASLLKGFDPVALMQALSNAVCANLATRIAKEATLSHDALTE